MINSEGSDETPSLSNLYDGIWKRLVDLENTSESTSSEGVQKNIDAAMSDCHKAIGMVNSLEIFSKNESVDEITTLELKYLLLPAFLGFFNNKRTDGDRIDAVRKSQDCYRGFIKLCKTFALTDVSLKALECDEMDEGSVKVRKDTLDSKELIKADMARRQEKIERFRAKMSLEKELQELYLEVKKEHVDEEIKRNYFLKLIKKWIADSVEALESIEAEIPILEHMKKIKGDSKVGTNGEDFSCSGKECNKHAKKKFTPFIITKDQVQKTVYGLGYPSIPTLTVDEFYDERVRQGLFPGPGAVPRKIQPDEDAEEKEREKESAEKDEKEDEDDEDELRKARARDEYRDDHRRGWGNTHNRS